MNAEEFSILVQLTEESSNYSIKYYEKQFFYHMEKNLALFYVHISEEFFKLCLLSMV